MANHNKRRGNVYESQVVEVLRLYGHHGAARTLSGSREDRGDIQGIPNTVIQAKKHREYSFGPWLDEARKQAAHAGVSRYAVVAKRRGVADVSESFAVLPLWLFAELLNDGGTDVLESPIDTAGLRLPGSGSAD